MTHHRILIVGGGTAGVTVAARLLRADRDLDVAVVEPSENHYYQPAWTLVGGGDYDVERTVRPQRSVLPGGAGWIRERVAELQPDSNRVVLESGEEVGYEWLILCPGIQLDWDKVEGLPGALGRGGVCTNYLVDQCAYTWECLKAFEGGTALFTAPNTPVKCGGAPQKIMYLAADHFRRRGLLHRADIRFTSGGSTIFGVPRYKATLEKVVARYGIKTLFHHNLRAIRAESKEAVFDVCEHGNVVSQVTIPYEMIHVTPPMSAPDIVARSPLADARGWIDVDKHTLRSTKYANVFALGDATNSPNAKTGAAVRKQAPVVVANLLAAMASGEMPERYDGYGSCPLITGYGKLVLAEFKYGNEVAETFPFDQSRERRSMYWFKKHFLPWMYWNRMLKGRA